jgi:hypothetical protein
MGRRERADNYPPEPKSSARREREVARRCCVPETITTIIGKRIWSELTHDATNTVVIRNCDTDELFFQLAVCPATISMALGGEFEVECGSAACTYGDVVSREPQPLMLRLCR